jgi:hypothetical protein
MVRRAAALLAPLLLAACVVAPADPVSGLRFASVTQPLGVARSNAELAEDFLDLTFRLESGEELAGLLRYEEPIRVHLASSALAPYRRDVEALFARLRTEAGIDIAITDERSTAQLHLEAVPVAQLARVFPSAACFIVPGETSWAGFVRRRSAGRARWSEQETLRGAAVFLPADSTPQDMRDCIHEEITQALGPANDLYRLPDSIWNDDNFHGIATPFDMLMLRLLYQPELASGMDREAVAALLPSLLDRENPQGRGKPRQARYPESRRWAMAIEVALSRRESREARVAAARLATELARAMTPVDHRLVVALLTLGRLELRENPTAAVQRFTEAYALSNRLQGAEDLRTAHAGVHVAAMAVAAGRNDDAIALAERHAPAAIRGQNAVLLAGLKSLEAEALLAEGRTAEAQAVRLDSLRWARYGFGDDDGALAREQAAIAALQRLDDR